MFGENSLYILSYLGMGTYYSGCRWINSLVYMELDLIAWYIRAVMKGDGVVGYMKYKILMWKCGFWHNMFIWAYRKGWFQLGIKCASRSAKIVCNIANHYNFEERSWV